MNLVINMVMIFMKVEWVNKRGKVSLETSMSHANVLMPYSWWRGDSRALSPVESILNFIWVLRSTRIWTLLSLPHRRTCLPLLLSYNLASALHRCKYLRYSAKRKPVSSSSCVFRLLSYTTCVNLALILTIPLTLCAYQLKYCGYFHLSYVYVLEYS